MNFNTEKIMELCNRVVDTVITTTSTKEIKEYINVLRLAGSKVSVEDLTLFINACPEGCDELKYILRQLIATSRSKEVDIDDGEINFYCKLAKAYQKNNRLFDLPSTAKKL